MGAASAASKRYIAWPRTQCLAGVGRHGNRGNRGGDAGDAGGFAMTPSALGSILVVEDDPLVRDLVASCLSMAGYAVEEAQDGAEAIHALDQHRRPVDPLGLVLLDMMLPEVDGLEV